MLISLLLGCDNVTYLSVKAHPSTLPVGWSVKRGVVNMRNRDLNPGTIALSAYKDFQLDANSAYQRIALWLKCLSYEAEGKGSWVQAQAMLLWKPAS